MLILINTLLDTPATCFGDQVLGHWKVEISEFKTPQNDRVDCDANFATKKIKYFELRAPNVAIDEDGFYGTWTMGYIQAIQVRLGGLDYMWYFNYTETPLPEIKQIRVNTYCTQHLPTQAWVHEEGVAAPKHACIRATNVKPLLDNTTNETFKPAPGPVNDYFEVDGRQYKLLPRKLQKKVEYGRKKAPKEQPLTSIYSGDKLPKNFDWRNVDGKSYVPSPFDQKKCGSCYACATSYMMMSRYMVQEKTTEYPMLSVQHLVDCNEYSQGCGGGFGEHVGRFVEDHGILTEKDYGVYEGVDKACHAKDLKNADRYYFTATQPLGGYYGAITDPVEMQWELFRNGPMAISIFVDDVYFRKFDPYGFDNSVILDEENKNRHYFYDEVNHLVLLVGWVTEEITVDGVTKNETFWIMQNSWGTTWGPQKDGTMKIAMGYNSYGIESGPVTTYYRSSGAFRPKAPVNSFYISTIVLGVLTGVFAIAALLFAIMFFQRKKTTAYEQVQ
ncbi:Dipeptidyl-peptidase_I [Hexamita inflata]|uniref:Dipeptidyl peptidase 1 n=1 Tax=Hexamita inflata TaxID=28002 RepID=A0AA86QI84_9EUKA|nr:Dipeptidyl-peptidase I [Hexamita inflata]